jgi:twitching motility protein PilT
VLALPDVLGELVQKAHGLILVTGATGTGKSTTVASMIDHVNHLTTRKIVTVEDPIEYLHRDDRCLIYQREVGHDTHTFAHALRHVLRQDPDIIMIGEIRDEESLTIALNAANTGHLVVSTLHTSDAVQSIQRILTFYEPHEQDEIRRVLAGQSARGGLPAACCRGSAARGGCRRSRSWSTPARSRTTSSTRPRPRLIKDAIQSGATQYKMQSFDQAMLRWSERKLITPEAGDPARLAPERVRALPAGHSRHRDPRVLHHRAQGARQSAPEQEPNWIQRRRQ